MPKQSCYFLLGILFPFLLVSCHSTPESVALTLAQVENCIDSYPDSAYTLLKNIPNPQNLHGKAQVAYCLLMTKAIDKTYGRFDSDSLIAVAAAYYDRQDNDPLRKGETYFYYNRVLSELGRKEEAMLYCLEAEKALEGSRKYKMLGMINEDKGCLNYGIKMYEKAISNFRTAQTYYEKAGDLNGKSMALANIGRMHLRLKLYPDSAYWYQQQALTIARENHCRSEFSILQGLGVIFRGRKEYEKSIEYLKQALLLDEKKEIKASVNLSIGYTYHWMDDLPNAEKYLKLSLDSANNVVLKDAYHCLHGVERDKGNLELALYYRDKSDSIQTVISQAETQATIAGLEKKYENEKLRSENLQIKFNQGVALGVCLFFLLIIIALIVYYLSKTEAHEKQIREIEEKIRANEEQISDYQHKMDEYKLLQDVSEEYRNKMADLRGRVTVLASQNKNLQEQLAVLGSKEKAKPEKAKTVSEDDRQAEAFLIWTSLREGRKRDITSEEWLMLYELIDFVFNQFYSRLCKAYPSSTPHDLRICCLLKLSISHETISLLFGISPDSLTKAKGRLKKRLNPPPSVSLDEYLERF